MKFSALALVGATAATTVGPTIKEQIADGLRNQAAEHYKAGVHEAVDTAADVHRIHQRFVNQTVRDFKQTL